MNERQKDTLQEGGYLSLTGKMLVASLGAWLVGKAVTTKIRGNRDEISAVTNALMSSRRFQEELNRPGASVDSVMDRLRVKQMSASEFQRVFGVPWPL